MTRRFEIQGCISKIGIGHTPLLEQHPWSLATLYHSTSLVPRPRPAFRCLQFMRGESLGTRLPPNHVFHSAFSCEQSFQTKNHVLYFLTPSSYFVPSACRKGSGFFSQRHQQQRKFQMPQAPGAVGHSIVRFGFNTSGLNPGKVLVSSTGMG